MDSWSASAREAFALILRRLIRIAMGAAFARAYAFRSARWLFVAVGLFVLRVVGRSKHQPRRRAG